MTDQKLRTSALPGWRLGCAALVLCAVMSRAEAAEQSTGEDSVAASDPCLTDNLCKAHYDEARKAYKEKRYDEAYKEYKAGYERRQAPWLLINVGRSLQRLGRNKESLDYYQRYLKADPNPKPETVTKVNEYIEQVKAGWGITIRDGFGQTETTAQIGNAPGQPVVPGSMGRPLPGFTIDLLDVDGKPADEGEISIRLDPRPTGLMPGYHGDPERTAETFTTIDGQRWAIPGDLARVEADGSITLLGRGSSSINSGGEKIFPEEVEMVLKAHPAIFDAVVVGVPDDRFGHRVAAIVQTRHGDPVDRDDLDRHCRVHLAPFKVPRRVVEVAEVQRQPSGKADLRWALLQVLDASNS